MTESPFVYGVELRDPPTASRDPSQYDLLFGPGNILLRHQYQPRQFSMADYDDPYFYATSNISYAFNDILRANISTAIVRDLNLTVPIGSTSTAVTLLGQGHAGVGSGRSSDNSFQNQLIIPLYAIIFLLSVVGNLLVILTLAQNKRMRTVTNVYLLNLAISDLLLGVFCMPFTLVGQVLRRFVFGRVMCKLIPYFQAVSVSVAVWTLVAISLERYFAICRPLSSRRWQTQFHAYKMIGLVWTVSFLANSPLCYVQRLQPVLRAGRTTGQMKCREVWPDRVSEKAYVLFHDVGLLFLPLLTMGFAYSMIVSKLWRGLRHEIKHSSLYQQSSKLAGQGSTAGGGKCGGNNGGNVGGVTNTGIATSMGSATETNGAEQQAHPTALGTTMVVAQIASDVESGKAMKVIGGTGKRIEKGFLLTSSLKKGSIKTTTAAVNFASNNINAKGNFNCGNNGGKGINRCASCTNGAGGTSSTNLCSSSKPGSNGSSLGNSSCESKIGKLRGFRHFFAMHQHGGLCRNQRYQLGSTTQEVLPELVETKFDETYTNQNQQHTFHHHCHHPHAYHHQHQHLHNRIPTNIVKNALQDATHETVLSTGEANSLEPGSSDAVLLSGSGCSSTSGAAGGGTCTNEPVASSAATEDEATLKPDSSYQFSRHAIRSTYMDKSIEAKKKVIRMLFVIIVEFFVCWAPLHILNTVYLYSPSFVYQYVNSSGIALVQLMAYISSCCNPITYCFMNRRFRQAFLGVFSCYRNRMPICCCLCCKSKNGPGMEGVEPKSTAYLRQNTIGNHSGAERNNSDISVNDSLVYVGRGHVQRSEILILESEDRV